MYFEWDFGDEYSRREEMVRDLMTILIFWDA
jgi:hypothetical protein